MSHTTQLTYSAPSPFLSIWFHPAQTIRRIVDTNPGLYGARLVMLSGALSQLPQYLIEAITGGPSVFRLLVRLGIGVFGSLLAWYVSSYCLYLAGSTLEEGIANSEEVRAVYAWSNLPNIVFGVLGAPLYLLLVTIVPSTTDTAFLQVVAIGIAILLLLLANGLWSAVIFLAGYAEVNRFSIGHAIAALIAAGFMFGLLLGVPLALLVSLFVG